MVQTTGRGPAVAVLKKHECTPIGLQRVSFEDGLESIPFKGILTDKRQIRNERKSPWSLAYIKITQRNKEEV